MEPSKISSRKRFLQWSAGVITSVTALKLFMGSEPVEKNTTVKMLSQDGTLVEVDTRTLPGARKKITDKELQDWIKK
jgi:hypothetical protein